MTQNRLHPRLVLLCVLASVTAVWAAAAVAAAQSGGSVRRRLLCGPGGGSGGELHLSGHIAGILRGGIRWSRRKRMNLGSVVGLRRIGRVGFGVDRSVGGGVAVTGWAVAGYGDVSEGTWYTDAVQWSVDNGITDIGEFCFGPETPVSRGETAVWIYNMENQPAAGERHSFTDVTNTSQDDAISWMANTGVTTGTPPTTFAPDETLKRAPSRSVSASFGRRAFGATAWFC